MIEINLVPDVKQELLRAERTRASVISLAILVSIIAGVVVVLLALYVFGAQTVRSVLQDNAIKDESAKLESIEDLDKTLTVQNQLSKLGTMHDDKSIDSRLFDLIVATNPPAPNDIRVTTLTLSATDKTVTVDGQAINGYGVVEVFRKTIEETRLVYLEDEKEVSVPIASNVNLSETSYGEDSEGRKVLRFTISFTYDPVVFARASTGARFSVPSKTNVTDSFLSVPQTLFAAPAKDIEEDN